MRLRLTRHMTYAAALLALTVGQLANWPMVSSASAHANLVATSPAAGQQAGGTIDRVQLVFDEPIAELVPTIEGPDGAMLSVSVTARSQQQFDLEFESLVDEGIYVVRYEFVSIDDDRVELGHAFEFDRAAPAPLPLTGPVLVARSGSTWGQWLITAGLAAVVLGLAATLHRRRRALAQLGATSLSDGDGGDVA